MLDGRLDLSLLNGFMPFNGEQFVILTSGGLSGSFIDNIIVIGNVVFTVEYSPPNFRNDVVLESNVVPEPSTFLIFGLGLAGMGAFFTRRSRCRGQGD
jgi:hypothetical protein